MITIERVNTRSAGGCNACFKKIPPKYIYEISFSFEGMNHSNTIRLCEKCLKEFNKMSNWIINPLAPHRSY